MTVFLLSILGLGLSDAIRRTEHEAGHFLGDRVEKGEWHGRGHDIVDARRFKKGSRELEHARQQDVRLLMRDGGASWKIPFDLAKQFRGFPDQYPVQKK